jgi:hypothetical protein
MKEITLDLTTVKVPRDNSYSIEDMERMFGKRIAKAINKDVDKSGRTYRAIKTKEMAKICKSWKFWNRDIKKAYKNYVGMIIVPWVIINEPPVITCVSPETGELLEKKIDMSKYAIMNSDDERN